MGFNEDANPRLRQIVNERVSPNVNASGNGNGNGGGNGNGSGEERRGTEQIVSDVLEELIGGSVGGNNHATTKSGSHEEAGASGMSGRRSPDLW